MEIYKTAYARKRTAIKCANCGGLGHVYKTCNHPTISYGFICYKIVNGTPLYLMVQRKDSLCYVEFIRGKYELENRSYIIKLISNMTDEERERIRSLKFEVLWKEMWCKNEDEYSRNFSREFNEATAKFNQMKKGYYIRNNFGDLTFVNIDSLLCGTICEQKETEWGFPKGRRNVNENDLCCALREFREETGLNLRSIDVCSNMKPLEEIFSGSNRKRYKHVYYIAKYNEKLSGLRNEPSCREIKDVQWFDYRTAQDHIKDMNVERKELLKRLHQILTRSVVK